MDMEGLEPKKLALIRILQILEEYSDADHPLTQEDIAKHLEKDYGIVIERKAISRNLSLLKEAGVDIGSGRSGSYLTGRDFENSELHLLIDGILCSRHISAAHSKDLIERICGLSNKYFKSGVKSIYSVNDWNKTDNQALFYNIELIDEAIESGRQISYDYNKYGVDKRLHKSAHHVMSPYQMVLSNQRYYLMAFSEIRIEEQSKHRIQLRIGYLAGHKLEEYRERDLISNKELEAFYNRISSHEGELFTTFSNDQFYYQAIDSVYRTDGMMADLIVYPMGKNPLLIPTDYLKKCFAFNLKACSSIENGEVYDVGSEECIDISLNAELVPYVVSLLNDPRISWV